MVLNLEWYTSVPCASLKSSTTAPSALFSKDAGETSSQIRKCHRQCYKKQKNKEKKTAVLDWPYIKDRRPSISKTPYCSVTGTQSMLQRSACLLLYRLTQMANEAADMPSWHYKIFPGDHQFGVLKFVRKISGLMQKCIP